jgi:NarL family two-component system response regulator LiaR
VQDAHPDVALLDLVMPGGGGVAATVGIREASPNTAGRDPDRRSTTSRRCLPALRAGALSYLLKDVAAADLADAVRRAQRKEATLHPRVAARVVQALRAPESANSSLSEREREVLMLIAEGIGQPADRDEAGHRRGRRQDARQQHPRQARPQRPHAGRGLGLAPGPDATAAN